VYRTPIQHLISFNLQRRKCNAIQQGLRGVGQNKSEESQYLASAIKTPAPTFTVHTTAFHTTATSGVPLSAAFAYPTKNGAIRPCNLGGRGRCQQSGYFSSLARMMPLLNEPREWAAANSRYQIIVWSPNDASGTEIRVRVGLGTELSPTAPLR
jgi:hypothetical protein